MSRREFSQSRSCAGMRAARRFSALALAVIPMAGCFEHPIDEELEIRFLPTGAVVVSSRVAIGKFDKDEPLDEAVEARIETRFEEARRDLEAGEDHWSRQFAAIQTKTDRVVRDRVEGVLTRGIHRVYLKNADDLRAILVRSAGSVEIASGEGWEELRLTPLPGSRAGEAQRRRSEELLEDWSARVARYLERTRELYLYLDGNPDRAEICLAPLLAPGNSLFQASAHKPTSEESELVDPVQEAMGTVLEMFDFNDESGWQPDEIVHLATDPFPTRVVVQVPGRVLESDGFVVEREGRLAVPAGGLLGAVGSLEGDWIAPDPLIALVRSLRASEPAPIDVAAFAATPRVARSGASESAVRRALEKALIPARVYRVRWAVPPSPEGGVPDFLDWDALTK